MLPTRPTSWVSSSGWHSPTSRTPCGGSCARRGFMTRFTAASRRKSTPAELEHIKAALRRRVVLQQVLIATMTIVGLPLLALGPAIVAGFAWLLNARYWH